MELLILIILELIFGMIFLLLNLILRVNLFVSNNLCFVSNLIKNKSLTFLKIREKSNYQNIKNHTSDTLYQKSKNENKLYTTYDDYFEYINEIIKGKSNIIFPGNPTFYVTTTGSTKNQKKIPFFTKNNELNYPLSPIIPLTSKRIIYNLLFGKVTFFFRRGNEELYNNIVCANGITTQMINILKTTLGSFLIKNSSTSPFEVYKNDDPNYNVMNVHMIHALLEENVTMFCGYFSRSLLEQFDNLIKNHDMFEKALVEGKLKTSSNTFYRFKPNIERSKILKNVFNDFNRKGWIKKLWPKLDLLICGSSGSFGVYLPRLKYYTDNVEIFSPFCASTEMVYGININNYDDDKYYFDTRLGVIHVQNELLYENDKYLRLVVSTKSGLDRYLIDDVISINKNELSFYYEGRFDFYEKLGITERTFVKELTFRFEKDLHDYMILEENNNLIIFLEFYSNKKLTSEDINILSNLLKIKNNKSEIKFVIVENGTFKVIVDIIETTITTNPPDKVNPCREQLKIPRLINSTHYLKKYLDYVGYIESIN